MASHSVTGTPVPVGLNHGNQFFVRCVTTKDLANGEVLSVTTPAGVPANAIPYAMLCYSLAAGVYTRDADIGVITDYTVATRVVRITASGDVASGSIVILAFVGD